MTTIKERVAKGVELLDSKIPDWCDKIKLETFDVSSVWDCVVSQATGMSFLGGMEMLFPDSPNLPQNGADCGFTATEWWRRTDDPGATSGVK